MQKVYLTGDIKCQMILCTEFDNTKVSKTVFAIINNIFSAITLHIKMYSKTKSLYSLYNIPMILCIIWVEVNLIFIFCFTGGKEGPPQCSGEETSRPHKRQF